MNGKDLLESMSHVDEKYIAEAEEAPKRRLHWQPLAAAAACLVLVLAGVWEFRPRQEEKAQDPMVAAAYQAKGVEQVQERSMDGPMEEQVLTAGTPMMLPALAEMTVRVVEQGEDAYVCVVTDPGTSDYQVDDQVKIALPDEFTQPSPQAVEADQNSVTEETLYRISFLPDQGAERITPAQWTALEDEGNRKNE